MNRLLEILKSTPIDTSQLKPVAGAQSDTIFQAEIVGREAVAQWLDLRERLSSIGYRAVFVGGPNGSNRVLRELGIDTGEDRLRDPFREFEDRIALPRPHSPNEILAAAENLPFERWLEQRRDPQWRAAHFIELAEHLERLNEAPGLAKLYRDLADQNRGLPRWEVSLEDLSWVEDNQQFDLQPFPSSIAAYGVDYSLTIADFVLVLFVPVSHAWQIPALLPFSVEEGERPPETHVAALKWMEEKVEAELFGFSDRTLDFYPFARPQTQEAAMRLANDIHTYATCPWTGDPNATVPQFAAYLMNSPCWSFSWP